MQKENLYRKSDEKEIHYKLYGEGFLKLVSEQEYNY